MERYGSIESVLRAEIVELGAALDAEREKVKELKEWQRVVVGTGTDQEAVVRMAATEYTKTAVQCWKDENAKLTAQLATLQAQLAQPIRVCQGCGRVGRDGWVTARYECDEWSKEKPTVAGWYWWRQSRNDVAQPCFVYWAERILYLHRCWAKYPDPVLSDVRGGEWQGPITPHDQEA